MKILPRYKNYIHFNPRKLVSKSVYNFIKSHPLITSTLNLQYGLGSYFNINNDNCLNIGLRKKNWVLHELGHIIVEKEENLLIENYNSPIANEYSFDSLMREYEVMRNEIVLVQFLNHPSNKIGNVLYNKKLLKQTFKGSEQDLELLYKEVKKTFLTPITKNDEKDSLEKLNKKLLFLKDLNPKTDHFTLDIHQYIKSKKSQG